MSNTIAHRPHVQHHVPLMPVLAVIIAIAAAAAILWAINQPQATFSTAGGTAISAPLVQPAPAPSTENPTFRHAQMRVLQNGGYSQAYLYGRLHQVDGSTTDPLTTTPAAGSGERLP
jgi:hypothetical protein